jgi:hypothetical protein
VRPAAHSARGCATSWPNRTQQHIAGAAPALLEVHDCRGVDNALCARENKKIAFGFNAASLAGLTVTIECLIADKPEGARLLGAIVPLVFRNPAPSPDRPVPS